MVVISPSIRISRSLKPSKVLNALGFSLFKEFQEAALFCAKNFT